MSIRTHRLLLALVLGIYLALAAGYGILTPLFEAPDEHLHYFTVEFIARERRLPTTRDAGMMGQEAAQPPLYYLLGAILLRSVPAIGNLSERDANPTAVSPSPDQLWHNPQAEPGDPRGESHAQPPINVNMFIHGPAEAWPWRDYALAAHLVRLLSTVMGLGTLLCIYGAGRKVWPGAPDRALLATTLVAFLPQYAFLHGVITNDAAITLFSAAAMWQLLNLLQTKTSSDRAWRAGLVLLGITIGLAMLSKAAGLLLLVFCAAVLAVFGRQRGGRGRLARALGTALLVAAPALLVGGWLLWRNWMLYGDPTAANQFVLMAGGERPYTFPQVWNDLDRVWFSLFGLFGWMNLHPPAWVWAIWSAIFVAALGGGLWGIVNPGIRGRAAAAPTAGLLFHPAIILFAWFALVALAWLQFMLRTPADQGRLFFPALVPVALGAAFGLSQWPRPWTQLAVAGLALLTTVYSLLVVIPAAYAPPPQVEDVPTAAVPLQISFPEGLELLGVTIDTPSVRAGEWAWLTLYWRANGGRQTWAPLVYLELFGRAFERIGWLTAYHGRGNFPATLWPEGAIIADRIAVRPNRDAETPVEARLTVKLDESADGTDIGTLKVIPAKWPEPVTPLARLGEAIDLAAAELSADSAAPGAEIAIRLRWQVVAPPGPALLHTFIHLGDPAQSPLAQSDGPIMGDVYPSRLWAAGEVFEETVTLTLPENLPPGSYPVNLGVYDFESGTRLPITVDGERIPGDTYPVGRLFVVVP